MRWPLLQPQKPCNREDLLITAEVFGIGSSARFYRCEYSELNKGEQPPRARFLFRCEQRLLVFPVGFGAVVKKQMLDACACQSQLSLRPTPWMLHRLK